MENRVTVKLSTRAYLNGGLNIWTFKPWLRKRIKLFGTFLPLHSGTFWYHVNVKILSLIWVEVVLFAVYLVFGYIKMRYFEWLQEFCVLPGFKYLHACGQYYFFRNFLFEEHIKLMIHYSNKDRNNESSNGVLNGDELWTERCREKNPPPTLNCSPCFR